MSSKPCKRCGGTERYRCRSCVACTKAKSKQRNLEQPAYRLGWMYGLEMDAYKELLAQQDSRCAICSEPVKLVVDHCHETDNIRGLLCSTCNIGLGQFKDDPDLLIKASDYLIKSKPLTGVL